MSKAPQKAADFVEVSGKRLHVQRLTAELGGAPLVFLHEGLGSVELWRDFPKEVVQGTGHPALVYSRYGNGWSTPLAEPRRLDYMHTEALDVLPAVIGAEIDEPPILIGHSDGASIAIIYAGSGHPVRALVLVAPHVFVENETLRSIASIRDSFEESDMIERMAAYHEDPGATFRGWADIWLNPQFAEWNIEGFVPGVRCPTLLIQGDADEYGTEAQLNAIEAATEAEVERLLVAGARHSPHLSHPDRVIPAVTGFISGLDLR